MQKYKVDWLAFTISLEEHNGDKRYFDENILEVLRFDKEDFEEIPGRLFLQSWCDL